MNEPAKDPLADAVARLKDNAYWRHYVHTLSAKRDAAVHNLLYGKENSLEALRGEARAMDQLVAQLKRYGVTE